MSGPTPTRRRVLGVAGAASLLGASSLAGCSELPLDEGRDDDVRIPGSELQAIADEERTAVPRTVPISIAESYLEAGADRVRSLLATVPTPLDSTEVPNGAVRAELERVHDRTETTLETAESAPSRFEAMETLRRARGEAQTLATAWAAIDDGLTREDVAERIGGVEEARTDLLGRWRYLGEDPVRATLVHATIERYVERARRTATSRAARFESPSDDPIDVGEFAGDIERALAAIEDASHCYDRFASSLAEPADLIATIDGSAARLVADAARRGSDLPDIDPDDPSTLVDRDVSDTPAEPVLERFSWDLDDPTYPAEQRSAGRPARAIVLAHGVLARFRAFESLLEEIDGGESFSVESADDVRAIRSAAVDAVAAAHTGSSVPDLTNRELSGLTSRLAEADRRLSGFTAPVRPNRLHHVVAEYVSVRAIAEALPPTSESVARVVTADRW